MLSVLGAIRSDRRLRLQILATGMHLDPAHGEPLAALNKAGFPATRVIDWPACESPTPVQNAIHTGRAVAEIGRAFHELETDIALVVGDRVEAFAGASAGHIAHVPVAHVHGGDRAAGQVDDSLRHAITKLAHLHFPATKESAGRIHQLGEDRWRITRAGSPGLDGIGRAGASLSETKRVVGRLTTGKFALVLLHPADAEDDLEFRRAGLVLNAVREIPFSQIVVVYPNNDPGSAGILGAWESAGGVFDPRLKFHRDLARPVFLSLLRDCAALVGNSSSGIIEAASFGTPVLDIGPRQLGRERGANVAHASYSKAQILSVLGRIWNDGRPKRFRSHNIYGGENTSRVIAGRLASVPIDDRLLHKLIRY
jgi:GDP/UDP-N,N'-diacetylbacillosamine 2-epimerase (hydrolysing)